MHKYIAAYNKNGEYYEYIKSYNITYQGISYVEVSVVVASVLTFIISNFLVLFCRVDQLSLLCRCFLFRGGG